MKNNFLTLLFVLLICSCNILMESEKQAEQRQRENRERAEKYLAEQHLTVSGILADITYAQANSISSTESTRLDFTDGRILYFEGLQPGIVFQRKKCNTLKYDKLSGKVECNVISEKCNN